mmetsp:Transcript_12709/g.26270  ORF Transcript_12709/g.26270 Transcript_12709/m.26270 type:complete len:134 (+) Transcript_12709:124-525(+)
MPVVVEEPDDLLGTPSRQPAPAQGTASTVQANGGGPNLRVRANTSKGAGKVNEEDGSEEEEGLADSERLDDSSRYVRGGGILASRRDVDIAPTEFAEGKDIRCRDHAMCILNLTSTGRQEARAFRTVRVHDRT